MEVGAIAGYFKDKSILITGATGFLGKILVEKILRVQPDVKKIFLLVRAPDAASAKQRMQTEVMEKEIFSALKEKHGSGFQSFLEEKLFSIAGDIIYHNLGIEGSELRELSEQIDIIVNSAATTNFYERYDVSLDVNVLGAKHVCEVAKKCVNLKMLLHVSTAYVASEQEGLLLEEPLLVGETLKEGTYLDIDAELKLVENIKKGLQSSDSQEKTERSTMKELGLKRARHFGWPNTYVFTKAMGEMLLGQLRGDLPVVIMRPSIITSTNQGPLPGWIEGIRTIDSIIMAYAEQKLSCFLADLDLIMDVIPGDMVVNAMMVATVVHSDQQAQTIYHICSSARNPAPYSILKQSSYRYFADHPLVAKSGETIQYKKVHFCKTMAGFKLNMFLRYKLPLEMLHLVNLVFFGLFSQLYTGYNRKYRVVMHLIDLYTPYILFKGIFDDTNLGKLRMIMKDHSEALMFDLDPMIIDWEDYFYRIHIPGLLKYECKLI